MRFGEYLLNHSIPAWAPQYLDYNKLKAILRELTESIENPNHSTNPSPGTLSILRPITVDLTDHIHNQTYSNSMRGESITKHGNDATHLVTNSVTFNFSDLISVIQSNIQTQVNNNTSQQQILEIEKRFLTELETEMNKVSLFYHQQSVYFAKQAETLMQRLRNIIKLKPNQNLFHKSQSLSFIEEESINHKNKTHINDIENEFRGHLDRTQSKSQTSSSRLSDAKLDVKREKKQLRKLFRATYHAIIHKLSSYRLLNVTAIRKICKKHDKKSYFKHLQNEIDSIVHSGSNFGDDHLEQYLIERLENAYGEFLSSPNHKKKCEAIQQLRALGSIAERQLVKPSVYMQQKKRRRQRQKDSCFIGFYLGSSLTMFVICALLIMTTGKFKEVTDSAEFYRSFYGFRTLILVSLYLWLFGWNLHIWHKKKFNHPFIFEADPSTVIQDIIMVFKFAGELTCITMLTATLYLLVFIFDKFIIPIPLWCFSIALLVLWLIYLMYPRSGTFLQTRDYLMSSFWRIVRAPFTKVHFVDFFIADQWCSLFTVVVDLTFSMCFFATGEFRVQKTLVEYKADSICAGKNVKMWIKLLRFIPYWLRFAQCIKRFYDTSSKSHLVNGGKYFTCILTSILATLDEHYEDNIWYKLKIIRFIFASISTIYAFMWDLIKDWGLLHFDCKYILLRNQLRFNPMHYYIAIIINFLFRISWGIYLFPRSFLISIQVHYIALGLGAIEIIRRCIWNIFRLENEHINNCGEFRVVKDIPPLNTTQEPIDEDSE
eukprot:501619_1